MRSGWYYVAIGGLLGLLACSRDPVFQCANDEACASGDQPGACQSTGYCSFPDEECASGQRYGDYAGSEVANLCVPPSGDTDGNDSAGGSEETGEPTPECGDGVVGGDEVCDAADLAGTTCAALGFAGGALQCTADCTLDATHCTLCGNDQIDADEACDGTNFGNGPTTCDEVGLGDATEPLVCNDRCILDYRKCSACGDGEITAPEQCDSVGGVGDATCLDAGFGSGTLACEQGCVFDTTGCAECGNAQREGSEQCDGADLAGASCTGQGFDTGTLKCNFDCTFDTSDCEACGDDILSGTEECEASVPESRQCTALGYDSGVAGCNDCKLQESSCGTCGNGARDGTESCDQLDLGGATCTSQGFSGGSLTCASNCTFNTSACTGAGCGNGTIDGGEDCDGATLGGSTCQTEGFEAGSLSCDAACNFDTSGCSDATESVAVQLRGSGDSTPTAVVSATCVDTGQTCSADAGLVGWSAVASVGCTVMCPIASHVRIHCSVDMGAEQINEEITFGSSSHACGAGEQLECESSFNAPGANVTAACKYTGA